MLSSLFVFAYEGMEGRYIMTLCAIALHSFKSKVGNPNARLFTPVFKLSSTRRIRCDARALLEIISAIQFLALIVFANK